MRQLLIKYDTPIVEHVKYFKGETEYIIRIIDENNSSIYLCDDAFASCLLHEKMSKLFCSILDNTIPFSEKFILITNDAEFHEKPIPNLPGVWIQIPNKYMEHSKYYKAREVFNFIF